MKRNYTKQIFLIEDHHMAYFLWKKNNFNNQLLVHIDAHIDFHVNQLIDVDISHLNVGNFIYQSAKEKIVSELYWVIPGFKDTFFKNIYSIKKTLNHINSSLPQPKERANIVVDSGGISTKINNIKLKICTLDALPNFANPVLLDIDIDYFINKALYESNNISNIGHKKQWISIKKFKNIILSKVQYPKFITISYSVNGGWTPVEFRSLADKIYTIFSGTNERIRYSLLADKCFREYKKNLKLKKYSLASKFLTYAGTLNPVYTSLDVNYGILLLKSGNYRLAEKEFKRMNSILPNTSLTSFWLGVTNLLQNKLNKSNYFFNQVMNDSSLFSDSLLYQIYISIRTNDLKKGEKLLIKYSILAKNNRNILYYYFSGIIHTKFSRNRKSLEEFNRFLSYKKSFSCPIGMEIIEQFSI
ncbi:hypothetical protein A2960_02240 [Candidatus Gottesmanbacteria bacterium RIFCSPLOWO2_01_FULL_39_12b]|uniref:Uncharacterized protein n=1 Tax=Candidatus Gottesmanbacteria bacterium RIFCSPLOWO2_01_FULL_39_12b TaxID=1798388 RepID=A0A1F6AR28_9BACT|nr:MAG: hypothetical protein A2960_02240 [Candidatus Gottesmanbacteria bacterium RIFCSPLOWO2_01_FULL_39_12b]